MKKLLGLVVLLALCFFAGMVYANMAPEGGCPAIHHSISSLDDAAHDIGAAVSDLWGHKAGAMDAARHAVAELRKAQECKDCGDGR